MLNFSKITPYNKVYFANPFVSFSSNQIFKSKSENLDKDRGFVKEDNSGRSNIFSTGEKALYSYSPAAERAARQGLGGAQGLAFIVVVVLLVGIITVSISTNEARTDHLITDLSNFDELSKIA